MKSGPGPSTIEFGAKPSVIEPPLPSVTTSSEPLIGPAPFGGPSTTPGKLARPKLGPGPGEKDSTLVAKLAEQLCSPLGAERSRTDELHAEEQNPNQRRAASARPHELTKVDSRASSRSVVGRGRGDFLVASAPTDWSSDFPLIRVPPSRGSGLPTLTGFIGARILTLRRRLRAGISPDFPRWKCPPPLAGLSRRQRRSLTGQLWQVGRPFRFTSAEEAACSATFEGARPADLCFCERRFGP